MSENLVNVVLNKFFTLSEEHKKITEESAQALKEYEDYCTSSDADLDKKTGEILKKISSMDSLMQYAREHATDLEEAMEPFETSEGALESLRQKIALDSHNDPNAETLYTKASGQRLQFRQEIEHLRNLINGSKVQAKRHYDSQTNEFLEKKAKHDGEYKLFFSSDQFKSYLKLLQTDAAAFNSPGMVKLSENTSVSIGQRRVRLPIPPEFEQELSVTTAGVFNSAAKTIGAPFSVPMTKGSSIYIDFDEKNGAYMLGGVQRFLLNVIKYFGAGLDGMLFCDPSTYDSEGLGHIRALSKGNNPFIFIPASREEMSATLSDLTAKYDAESGERNQIRSVLVFRNFPEQYNDEDAAKIVHLCENAEKYGITVVLTHLGSQGEESAAEKAVRACSTIIRSRNGGFYAEATREGLFWYSQPSDIPDEIRRTYVEQRRRAEPVQRAEPIHHEAPPVIHETAVHNANSAPVQPIQPAEPPVQRAPEPVPEVKPEPIPTPVAVAEPAHVETAEPVTAVEPSPVTEPETVAEAEPETVEKAEPVAEAPEEEVTAAEETNAEPEEANEPEPVSEDSAEEAAPAEFAKGVCRIEAPFGNGAKLDLEESGSVKYISGSTRAATQNALDIIIGGVIGSAHPDNAEMWLYDLSQNDFSRYSGAVVPHVRYLILDESEDTAYAFVDKLAEALRRRVNYFRGKWNSIDEVPADVYMPKILVVINDFDVLAKHIECSADCIDKMNYSLKLRNIIKKGGRYGLRFVFADNEACEIPACLDGIVSLYADVTDENNASLRIFGNVPVSAVKKITLSPDSADSVPTAYDMDNLHAESAFAPDDVSAYVDKKPIIADISVYRSFNALRGEFEELIADRQGDTLVFAGESCSLNGVEPITISDSFAENIALFADAKEKDAAALTLMSIMSSLTMQDVPFEILAAEKDPLYSLMNSAFPSDAAAVSEGIAKVSARIRRLSDDIAEGKSDERFFVIFGAEKLTGEMKYLSDDKNGAEALNELIARGPRLGYHFIAVFNNVQQSAQSIPSELFEHFISFNSIGDFPKHCFCVGNEIKYTLFKPYLHTGIRFDGFEADEDGNVTAVMDFGYPV